MGDAPLHVQGRIDCMFQDAPVIGVMAKKFKHFRQAGFPTDLKTSQCKFDNCLQWATQLKLKAIHAGRRRGMGRLRELPGAWLLILPLKEAKIYDIGWI
jgi:hypothetical protein